MLQLIARSETVLNHSVEAWGLSVDDVVYVEQQTIKYADALISHFVLIDWPECF